MSTNTAQAHTLARLNTAAERLWPTLHAAWEAHAPNALGGEGLHPVPTGLSIEVLASIDSSNTELMRRARAGHTDPVLLVAVDQTAGRGRMGKAWVSQPGHSLTFSLGLPLRPTQWAGLSLAVGVSLAESLATLLPANQRPQLTLKWPNDLWLNGAKLAGILVETAHVGTHPFVVVGVGINVVPPEPAALAPGGVTPTGLAAHTHTLDTADVWQAVAPALLNDLLAFESLGFSAFAQRFVQRDALHGQVLTLSDGTSGTGCGVDDDGALLVLTAQGMRTVSSNEVSVRPQPPATRGAEPC